MGVELPLLSCSDYYTNKIVKEGASWCTEVIKYKKWGSATAHSIDYRGELSYRCSIYSGCLGVRNILAIALAKLDSCLSGVDTVVAGPWSGGSLLPHRCFSVKSKDCISRACPII